MEFLTTTLYFLITIGVLVFVHELGHFLAAISCGMRADVFALGMGNRVFGWNKINGFTFGKLRDDIDLQGNTDYRVAAFPIGGYVKISGMVDESLDDGLEGSEPQPWEYRAKPIWQRMIVISAGVVMNILLAIVIFWGISYVQGESLMQTTEIGMVVKDSPAAAAGLTAGDKIIAINDTPIGHWEAIQTTMYFDQIGKDLTLTIERSGIRQSVFIRRDDIPDISETTFGIIPNFTEAVINDVLFGKPAEQSGLRSNDIIVSINGEPVFNQDQVIRVISANPDRTVQMRIKRGEEYSDITVTPASDGRIGITVSARYTGPITTLQYGIFESFPRGVRQTVNATTLFGHSIWQLIAGKAEFSKSVGGPVKIAQIATRSAEIGFMSFLAFMALLSISLAVMNILPFPALDGGHLMLLLYELIAKKPLPHRIQIRIQQVGMVILLSFMVFVLYNDIFG
jgi:regulator of sigma E protease